MKSELSVGRVFTGEEEGWSPCQAGPTGDTRTRLQRILGHVGRNDIIPCNLLCFRSLFGVKWKMGDRHLGIREQVERGEWNQLKKGLE